MEQIQHNYSKTFSPKLTHNQKKKNLPRIKAVKKKFIPKFIPTFIPNSSQITQLTQEKKNKTCSFKKNRDVVSNKKKIDKLPAFSGGGINAGDASGGCSLGGWPCSVENALVDWGSRIPGKPWQHHRNRTE